MNLLPGIISIKNGFTGLNLGIVSACASSSNAIGEGFLKIKDNYTNCVIVGGSECGISAFSLCGFNALKALSTNYNDEPHKASRPLDQNRDGFVMADGAGALILEDYESAIKRKAKIYAEIVGYGFSSDAIHITSPDPNGNGGYKAMQNALKMANIKPQDIGYINLHATSTNVGDLAEIRAIKKVFNNYANEIPMSSTKSTTGHMLGAAGVIEAIISICSMNENILPPNINIENLDKECVDMNIVKETTTANYQYCMSNSFGFGGVNSSLIFKKFIE